MKKYKIGQVIYSFFEDFLKTQKGLRTSSMKSYRDVLRLFLIFVAKDAHRKITRLSLHDLKNSHNITIGIAINSQKIPILRESLQFPYPLSCSYR